LTAITGLRYHLSMKLVTLRPFLIVSIIIPISVSAAFISQKSEDSSDNVGYLSSATAEDDRQIDMGYWQNHDLVLSDQEKEERRLVCEEDWGQDYVAPKELLPSQRACDNMRGYKKIQQGICDSNGPMKESGCDNVRDIGACLDEFCKDFPPRAPR
jgi:hypothetical protein